MKIWIEEKLLNETLTNFHSYLSTPWLGQKFGEQSLYFNSLRSSHVTVIIRIFKWKNYSDDD